MRNFLNILKKAKLFAIDLIFPIECLGCGCEGDWLCFSCFRKLTLNQRHYCLACKTENNFGEICPICRPDYALSGVWIAGDYENPILSKLIRSLKYRFAEDISLILANFLALYLKNLINASKATPFDLGANLGWRRFETIKNSPRILLEFKNTLLIPVPLHKKRERWRGFNQAKTIAELLAIKFKLPLATGLIRLKHRPPQAKLSEIERKKNVVGCYAWQGNNLNGQNIILLDDVATTGSTLNECARTLKRARAGEIWGLVVAKG